MEFNKYSLYTLNSDIDISPAKDKVDGFIDELVKIDEYSVVKSYLDEKFGTPNSEENWYEYDDLNKSVYIKENDEVIEFCALKGENQYFGKGWKRIGQQ